MSYLHNAGEKPCCIDGPLWVNAAINRMMWRTSKGLKTVYFLFENYADLYEEFGGNEIIYT